MPPTFRPVSTAGVLRPLGVPSTNTSAPRGWLSMNRLPVLRCSLPVVAAVERPSPARMGGEAAERDQAEDPGDRHATDQHRDRGRRRAAGAWVTWVVGGRAAAPPSVVAGRDRRGGLADRRPRIRLDAAEAGRPERARPRVASAAARARAGAAPRHLERREPIERPLDGRALADRTSSATRAPPRRSTRASARGSSMTGACRARAGTRPAPRRDRARSGTAWPDRAPARAARSRRARAGSRGEGRSAPRPAASGPRRSSWCRSRCRRAACRSGAPTARCPGRRRRCADRPGRRRAAPGRSSRTFL